MFKSDEHLQVRVKFLPKFDFYSGLKWDAMVPWDIRISHLVHHFLEY